MRTSSGQNFIKIGCYLLELFPQNPQNWAQLGHKAKNKKKKLVYLKGKAENGKYPDLKTCKFRNYGWMVLRQGM